MGVFIFSFFSQDLLILLSSVSYYQRHVLREPYKKYVWVIRWFALECLNKSFFGTAQWIVQQLSEWFYRSIFQAITFLVQPTKCLFEHPCPKVQSMQPFFWSVPPGAGMGRICESLIVVSLHYHTVSRESFCHAFAAFCTKICRANRQLHRNGYLHLRVIPDHSVTDDFQSTKLWRLRIKCASMNVALFAFINAIVRGPYVLVLNAVLESVQQPFVLSRVRQLFNDRACTRVTRKFSGLKASLHCKASLESLQRELSVGQMFGKPVIVVVRNEAAGIPI